METNLQLKVTVRENAGKGYARKIRQEGLTPGVIYGPKNKKNVMVSFDAKKLKKALTKGGGINSLINLVEEKTKTFEKATVIVKQLQKDPIKLTYLHADFYQLDLTQKVIVEVPIHFIGKADGIKQGGIVQPIIREVKVKALPGKIPSIIEVDVTPLNIGDALHLEDLKSTDDYEITFDHNETVVTVVLPKEEEAPTPAEGDAAVAEGTAAAEGDKPAAEGTKPAEGGDKPADAKKEPAKKEGKK